MKVLVACEFSGAVRDAFRKRGHDAWSCDLLPGEGEFTQYHYQADVFALLKKHSFDMMIAHPPCTYLTNAANKWLKNQMKRKSGALVGAERRQAKFDSIKFFLALKNAEIGKIAIENPVGAMSSYYLKPSQIIQPYQFGHDHSKQTCLWLKNLPKLIPTKYIEPKIINGKKRWANQNPSCGSDNTRALPGEDRGKTKSRTFQGIAEAMAEQWG